MRSGAFHRLTGFGQYNGRPRISNDEGRATNGQLQRPKIHEMVEMSSRELEQVQAVSTPSIHADGTHRRPYLQIKNLCHQLPALSFVTIEFACSAAAWRGLATPSNANEPYLASLRRKRPAGRESASYLKSSNAARNPRGARFTGSQLPPLNMVPSKGEPQWPSEMTDVLRRW